MSCSNYSNKARLFRRDYIYIFTQLVDKFFTDYNIIPEYETKWNKTFNMIDVCMVEYIISRINCERPTKVFDGPVKRYKESDRFGFAYHIDYSSYTQNDSMDNKNVLEECIAYHIDYSSCTQNNSVDNKEVLEEGIRLLIERCKSTITTDQSHRIFEINMNITCMDKEPEMMLVVSVIMTIKFKE